MVVEGTIFLFIILIISYHCELPYSKNYEIAYQEAIMNFYIASSFYNSEMVRNLSKALELEGHKQSYDWTQNNRAYTMELLASIGKQEKDAVSTSDFFVLILPGGKGSHTEFGIALALNKRIYIYSPTNELHDFDKTTTFYHLDYVNKFVGTFEAFTAYIIKQECENKTSFSSKI